MILSIFLFMLLIFFSGIYSGSESALFSLSQGRRENMRKTLKGKMLQRALNAIQWMKNPEKTLASLLLLNLAVNMTLSELGDDIIANAFGLDPVNTAFVSLFVITALLLLFGEIFPKITAINMAEKWVLTLEPFLRITMAIAAPVARPVYSLAKAVISFLPSARDKFNEEELRSAVNLAEEQGLLNEDEKKRLQRSIAFYHDSAYAAMIPRSRIFMIPHNFTPAKAKKAFIESKRSQALVYHEKDGRILGTLHVRNLLPALYNSQKSIRNRIRNIIFLPETLSLRECLISFTEKGDESAAILDESGEFVGLLTLKDILSRITGGNNVSELEPNNSTAITIIDNNTYRVKGGILLDELNEKIGVNLQSEYAETLSGYILEELDGFPHATAVHTVDNIEFSDMKVKNRKIENLMIRIIRN